MPDIRLIRSYFYPRSPCGERPAAPAPGASGIIISIHALLAESDTSSTVIVIFCIVFLSTLSLRRATLTMIFGKKGSGFLSTLSLRRATAGVNLERYKNYDFYPRSPCGERPASSMIKTLSGDFYPRSPCGERPAPEMPTQEEIEISIHALLAESDFLSISKVWEARYFYPRSPCGERLFRSGGWGRGPNFYPRSPCGERLVVTAFLGSVDNFYPRSPCGERRRTDRD